MTLRELNTHRLKVIERAFKDVQVALRQLAGRYGLEAEGEYELAYQLRQREGIDQELFQAWDALRVAATVYAETGAPEPTSLTRFLELASRVEKGLRQAAERAAA